MAFLNGASVNVLAGDGTYHPMRYTILTATAGRVGTFSALSTTTNLAFLNPVLTYDPNDVYLSLTFANAIVTPSGRRVPNYAAAGSTTNQIAVAGGLTNAAILANDRGKIFTALNQLTVPQARAAFDTLSGEGYSARAEPRLQVGRTVHLVDLRPDDALRHRPVRQFDHALRQAAGLSALRPQRQPVRPDPRTGRPAVKQGAAGHALRAAAQLARLGDRLRRRRRHPRQRLSHRLGVAEQHALRRRARRRLPVDAKLSGGRRGRRVRRHLPRRRSRHVRFDDGRADRLLRSRHLRQFLRRLVDLLRLLCQPGHALRERVRRPRLGDGARRFQLARVPLAARVRPSLPRLRRGVHALRRAWRSPI